MNLRAKHERRAVQTYRSGDSGIFEAVKTANVGLVDEFLEEFTPDQLNRSDQSGHTALDYAILNADLEMVRRLVEHGANRFSSLQAASDRWTGYPCVLRKLDRISEYLEKISSTKVPDKPIAARPFAPAEQTPAEQSEFRPHTLTIKHLFNKDHHPRFKFYQLEPQERGSVPTNEFQERNIKMGSELGVTLTPQEYDKNDMIYFAPAFVVMKNTEPLPVLLMKETIWSKLLLDSALYPGGFQKCYKKVQLSKKGELLGDADYVFVWNFPSDLKYVPIYRRRVGEWLPERYDTIHQDDFGMFMIPLLKSFKVFKMRKFRFDTVDGVDLHILMSDDRRYAIPMITSAYFFEDLSSPQEIEITKVTKLTHELQKINISAYPCHKNHRAIIFFRDITHDNEDETSIFTMDTFMAKVEKENLSQQLISALKDACYTRSESMRTTIDKWYANMEADYLSSKDTPRV